jgi:hypothetical protein
LLWQQFLDECNKLFNVYPNANLDKSKPTEAQQFCKNQMKLDGQVMQYNGKQTLFKTYHNNANIFDKTK